ncbi:NADH(P)-binding-domain-containing protein [Schizophyllum commune]
MSKNIVIVGGHGQVALRLARLLTPKHSVTSIIRDPAHAADITAASATPLVLSIEDSTPADFAKVFAGKDVVYYTAGSGGKGGEARHKSVDHEGAVKVFDAIEAVEGPKPRLILISSVDVRDLKKPAPSHYNDADIALSKGLYEQIPAYMAAKYAADKDLSQRTAFKWTVVRPGFLSDNPGTGKITAGRTHITANIPRDDVAQVLASLLDREDAASLAIDIVSGDTPVEEALDSAIKNRDNAFTDL